MMQSPKQRHDATAHAAPAAGPARRTLGRMGLVLGSGLLVHALAWAQVPDYPITQQQRATAKQVAEAGVALSELAPNAPDSYKVKRGDTLWDISGLFLKRPWRWPELWGMNLEQIRNPHLIFPGQMLFLDKSGGRARLRVGDALGPDGSVRLSPRVRESALSDAIGAVPLNRIEPFLNEAVVLNTAEELAGAPRVVATQEGRVMSSRGEKIYVLGANEGRRDWRLFREPKPLKDPTTGEILGFEAAFVGTAEFQASGSPSTEADGKTYTVPDTYVVNSIRQEVLEGDRLAPVPPRDFTQWVPRGPERAVEGQVVSIYGEALSAGSNQIVTLNRGSQHGLERGHVLALWSDGRQAVDRTDPSRPVIKLPNERVGLLFVFRVFDRMSYALILSTIDPVKVGDRFTDPER